MSQATPGTVRRKRRLKRKAAVLAAGILSISSVAGASVLVQNFMSASFTDAGPPCLEKVAGADTAFDGFGFDGTTTATVDGVAVTEESITLDGLRGDRVTAQEVFVIENNCEVALDVSIGDAEQTGDWAGKYVEVWLGAIAIPTGLPGAVVGEYDDAPLVLRDGGPTTDSTGVVTIAAGGSVPVGVVVTTASAGAGAGAATWTVQATS